MLTFTGSDNHGNHSQIRKAREGYSVFTWHDKGLGVSQWREIHDVKHWGDAFKIATDWLKSDFSDLH